MKRFNSMAAVRLIALVLIGALLGQNVTKTESAAEYKTESVSAVENMMAEIIAGAAEENLETDETEEGELPPEEEEPEQDEKEAADETEEEHYETDLSEDLKTLYLERLKSRAAPIPVPVGFFTNVVIKKSGEEALGNDVKRDEFIRVKYTYVNPIEMTVGQDYTFTVPKEVYVPDGQLVQIKYGTDIIAEGVVAFDPALDKNVCTIQFNDKADAEGLLAVGVGGDIWIQAQFSKERIKNEGRQIIDFELGLAGGADKVTVDFAIDKATADVKLTKAVVGAADLVNKQITWKIDVTASTSPADVAIQNLVITDTLPSNLTYVADSGECTSAGGGTDKAGFAYDAGKNELKYTFPPAVNTGFDDKAFTLTFKTAFELGAFQTADKVNFINKAKGGYEFIELPFTKDPVTGDSIPNTTVTVPRAIGEVKANTEVSGGMLDKQGALAAGARQIDWSVTINGNGFGIENPKIVDTLPAGLTLAPATVKLVEKSGSGTNLAGTAGTLNIAGQTLTYTFNSPISKAYVLTYSTTVADRFYEENNTTKFKNNVEFTGGPGPGLRFTKSAEVTVGNSLISKSGAYNRKNHTITWTVNLNNYASPVSNLNVTDEIPAGLSFVMAGGTFNPATDIKVVKGDLSAISFGYSKNSAGREVITASIPSNITSAYSFQFETTVDDNNIWAVNGYKGKPFTNTAKVTVGSGAAGGEHSASSTPEIISEMLKKTAVSYNTATKEITWQVVLNQNGMTLTNGRVEDLISAGQEYVSGSFALKAPSGATVNEAFNAGKLTLTLPAVINEQYTATYKTRVVDTDFLYTNEERDFTNTAVLYGDELPAPISSTASQKVTGAVLTKTGSVKKDKAGNSYLEWELIINKNKMLLDNPVIVDELSRSPMLELDPESIKLYSMTVNADGSLTNPVTVPTGADNVVYNDKTGMFEFHFLKTINEAYKLVFRTDFGVDAQGKNVSNKVYYKGSMAADVTDSTSVAVNSSSAGGSTSIVKGSVEIVKTDSTDPDVKLPGAVFQLKSKYATYTSEPTDDEGKTGFSNIRAGTYILKEIKAPIGYQLNTTEYSVQIKTKDEVIKQEIKNDPIIGEFNLTKADADDFTQDASGNKVYKPLKGAEIEICKKDGTVVATEISDEKGKISVADLRYGDYYYVEKKAPDKYMLDTKKYPFKIETHGEIVEETLLNKPAYSTLEITVLDDLDRYVEGVTISLYDDPDKNFMGDKVSDKNGRVLFEGLREGTYYYRQTDGPEGYIYDDKEYSVKVDGDNGKFQAKTRNAVIMGELFITKVDGDEYIELDAGKKQYTKPLAGAVIGVYASDGTKISEAVTDNAGLANFEKLPYGTYHYQELKAPEGYKLDETKHSFSIITQGEKAEGLLTNKKAELPKEPGEDLPKEPEEELPKEPGEETEKKIIAGAVKLEERKKGGADQGGEEPDAAVKNQMALLPKTGEESKQLQYMLGILCMAGGVLLYAATLSKRKKEKKP